MFYVNVPAASALDISRTTALVGVLSATRASTIAVIVVAPQSSIRIARVEVH